MESLSTAQARRIALVAQGFRDPRHTTPTMRTLSRTLARTGVLQVDSVNVLQRAHYMPLFSRMGPYDVELLRRASERRPRRMIEFWAHVQAFMPVDLWPVMQHRMDRYRASPRWGDWQRSNPRLVARMLEEVGRRGASTARQLDDGAPRDKTNWGWNWSEARKALDYLFLVGDLAIASRNSAFECVYDLPERVLPPHVLTTPTPEPADAHRELVRRAAMSHGVGTEQCLRDYFRMEVAEVKPAIRSLVDDGELLPVTIEGWKRPGLPSPRRDPSATGAGARPAQPVRPGGLGARAHAAAVRLPLPDRDLRARAEAGVRLLRAAVPARRPDRRPGRPQGRPQVRPTAGAGVVRRGAGTAGDRLRAGRGAARPGLVAGAGRDRGVPRGATWPSRSVSSCGRRSRT